MQWERSDSVGIASGIPRIFEARLDDASRAVDGSSILTSAAQDGRWIRVTMTAAASSPDPSAGMAFYEWALRDVFGGDVSTIHPLDTTHVVVEVDAAVTLGARIVWGLCDGGAEGGAVLTNLGGIEGIATGPAACAVYNNSTGYVSLVDTTADASIRRAYAGEAWTQNHIQVRQWWAIASAADSSAPLSDVGTGVVLQGGPVDCDRLVLGFGYPSGSGADLTIGVRARAIIVPPARLDEMAAV